MKKLSCKLVTVSCFLDKCGVSSRLVNGGGGGAALKLLLESSFCTASVFILLSDVLRGAEEL